MIFFKVSLKVLCIKYETIGALIKEHNKILFNLSEEFEESYNLRCDKTIRNNSNCSYNSCSFTLPKFKCYTTRGLNKSCECPNEGLQYSYEYSTIKVPINAITDDKNISEMFKNFI